MTRRKRPYVPKTKGASREERWRIGGRIFTDIPRSGCYQCSQRRIHCDRTQPSCGKCVSKGILCSGFGVRYRFCDGSERLKGRAPMEYPEASDALDSSGSLMSSAAYIDRGASIELSRSETDYGAAHGQPRPDSLQPALAWGNSEGSERFLVKYCMYASLSPSYSC